MPHHWCLLLLITLALGCSDGETRVTRDESGSAVASTGAPDETAATENEDAAKESAASQRKTVEGRWLLVMTQRENNRLLDFPLVILDIAKDEQGSFGLEITAAREGQTQASVTSAEIADETVDFDLDLGGRSFDYEGKLVDGFVFGNVVTVGGRCQAAYLLALAPEARTLENMHPRPAAGSVALETVYRELDPVEAIRRIVNLVPRSPTALFAYQVMFGIARDEELDAATVNEAAEEYIKLSELWGPRYQVRARMLVAMILAQRRYLPEVALQWLDQAESELNESLPPQWKAEIGAARVDAETTLAVGRLSSGTDEEREGAIADIRRLKEQNAHNQHLLYALAEYEEKSGNIDDALDQYAKLATLPMMERLLQNDWAMDNSEKQLPSKVAARLWRTKQGKTDGFNEYLDDVYDRVTDELIQEMLVEADDAGETPPIFCELFTGARCPPCIAADLAIEALDATYPDDRLIVLRYHQHIPQPDPLANEDAKARFDYYRAPGTPAVYINGRNVVGVGGESVALVNTVYNGLIRVISSLPKEKSEIQLQATATVKDDIVSISVTAEGTEPFSETVRLKLVLAEENARFAAFNGIRSHEMLVRAMPAGPEGSKPENGRFQIETTVDVASIKQQLADYLFAYEQVNRTKFMEKPLELKQLRLVAFLQDDLTRRVLYCTSTPVVQETTAALSGE